MLTWVTCKDFIRHPLNYSIFLLGSCVSFVLFFSDYARLRIATYWSTKKSPLQPLQIAKICVIIPARNEEGNIARTLQYLEDNASDPSSLDVIVADGGSRDKTIEVARQAARNLKRLGSVRVITADNATGRGIVLNAGIRAAETSAQECDECSTPKTSHQSHVKRSSPSLCTHPGSVSNGQYSPGGESHSYLLIDDEEPSDQLGFVEHPIAPSDSNSDGCTHTRMPDAYFFLHADSRVEAKFDDVIRRELGNPQNVMGAFKFEVDREALVAPLPGLEIVEVGAHRRNTLYWLPYGDQGYFLRKEMLDILGGIPNVVFMEDFEFIHRARRFALEHNMCIHIDPMKIHTSPRRFERNGFCQNTAFNQWVVFAYTVLRYSPQQIFDVYYQVKGD